jgi:hypothetical protein
MNTLLIIAIAIVITVVIALFFPRKRKHWQTGYRTIMMDKPSQRNIGYSEPKKIDLTIPESYRREAQKEKNEPDFKIPPGMFD